MNQARYEVKNVDSVDAPAFGVLEIVQFIPNKGWIEVRRPTQDNYQLVLVNWGNIIRAGKLGTAFSPFDLPPFVIQYNNAATPAAGDNWGTVAGQWYLQKNKTGFQPWPNSSVHTGTWCFQLKVCSPPA